MSFHLPSNSINWRSLSISHSSSHRVFASTHKLLLLVLPWHGLASLLPWDSSYYPKMIRRSFSTLNTIFNSPCRGFVFIFLGHSNRHFYNACLAIAVVWYGFGRQYYSYVNIKITRQQFWRTNGKAWNGTNIFFGLAGRGRQHRDDDDGAGHQMNLVQWHADGWWWRWTNSSRASERLGS